MDTMIVKFFGTRGTMPVSGSEYELYGTATSCIAVSTENETVIIDAGTGILRAARELDFGESITVLISHPHIDHVSALPVFTPALEGDIPVTVYGARRGGLDLKEQFSMIMRSPLWPVGLESFSAKTSFINTDSQPFTVGEIEVSFMEGNHPGGVNIYKLTYRGKSVVFAVDYEHGDESDKALSEFARNADLLVYDVQYSEEEYSSHIGWGHSTARHGAALAENSGVKQVIFTHYGIYASDETLGELERDAKKVFRGSSFAKADTEVLL